MSIVECRAWSVACCVSRVACRILLSLLATHALAVGLASGANVGCADFEVEQPRPHGGIIRAEDFGFSTTNEDNAAAINRAIEACRRDGASRLELTPGTYRCHGSDGIVLDGWEDLTLDGKGALLVFWRKHPKDWDAKDGGPVGEGVNLFLNRCRRVRVENLTMDWDWGVAPLGFLGVCVDKHIDEADNVWCEGTGCTNVVVRGCTFENCAARNLVNGVSAQIYCGVRIPSSKGWPEKNVVPTRDAQLKAEVEERLARGPAADVIPACRDIISDIIIEGNVFINPRGQTLYAENGDNIVFRDNRVEFDGHTPYELLPDAGKEKQSPRNIENRKEAQP